MPAVPSARTDTGMDSLVNGFALLFNGAVELVSEAADWKVLAGLALAGGLGWLARLEIDDTDLAGVKPYLPRG